MNFIELNVNGNLEFRNSSTQYFGDIEIIHKMLFS